jgi:hypothetical protein
MLTIIEILSEPYYAKKGDVWLWFLDVKVLNEEHPEIGVYKHRLSFWTKESALFAKIGHEFS